ncbi:Dam family site-specific DNA-(adenine-N6)-methyltransferase [Lonepinella sp. BR2919]|uniref:Dam family site-specific DNA-(adenine-N6)-methyltransferase n=1 Tax=unclassified Lonepinella TaxID=2642006 RepID=UPI003F6DB048
MFSINNRRYLGSKYKLLGFIDEIVKLHCKKASSFADIFGGTGCVAYHFNDKFDIIVNDILKSNVLPYYTFLSAENADINKLTKFIDEYNTMVIDNYPDNYYSTNFQDTFLSYANMKKVGVIRDNIDYLYSQNHINFREKAILITALIYAIDKIANTVGHYDAFRKNGELDKELYLNLPNLSNANNNHNNIYNTDANELVKEIQADIVYIDPPYNSRQYCDAYHFLENVAENLKPTVLGVARKMDRSHLKSDFCTNKASLSFKNLIDNIKAKYIILSYNNTMNKINSRSNAKILDSEILEILQSKGKVSVYEKDFNAFTTGKTKISEHKERIFVCEVGKSHNEIGHTKNDNHEIIKSPFNYTGGKAKLYPQIRGKLPENIETLYDVFSGGMNIGINIEATNILCVDNNKPLMELVNYLSNHNYLDILESIESKIIHYNLSDSFRNGYEYYNCNSSNGLGQYNKNGFNKLKKDYNNKPNEILFLMLIIFSFNNQIRFNSKGEFNLPVGKRDFNNNLRIKLKRFMDKLHSKNIKLINEDFRMLNIEELAKNNAFLYLDPPYILGTATYNESNGWTSKDESDLLLFLLNCHLKGIKFALSNVIKHKGKTHTTLIDWCVENGFNINHLNFNYKNASYQVKDKKSETQEVLITNY